MDILARKPELKEILGETGKEQEFKKILSSMSSEDLALLSHHLNKVFQESEINVWQKQRDVRKVECQIQLLREDYKTLMGRLQGIQNSLRSSFRSIFRKPELAEQQCTKHESVQGVIKTGWTIRNRPAFFGTLRGFTVMGVVTTPARKVAKETAIKLDYEGLKRSFNEGKKVAVWLGHILKGV